MTTYTPTAEAVRALIKQGDVLAGRFYCAKRTKSVKFDRWCEDGWMMFHSECGEHLPFEDVATVNGHSPLFHLLWHEVLNAAPAAPAAAVEHRVH
ncbi:hypothetical protein [Paracoccus sanguinis]|uniref:Uncharacterized protein n=1 Tax=Paracoccus sanguinis TaxID=1545044 RepID=A0A099GLW4_9RHOB|nr:hypothetical protein [Paracoccus sanguinis]KGJ23731.1 hypothetical protein IX56_00155 [Paracoccus sanguinis]